MLTFSMGYVAFDDFWYPTTYGQGRFGVYFDPLPEKQRNQIQKAVRGVSRGRM